MRLLVLPIWVARPREGHHAHHRSVVLCHLPGPQTAPAVPAAHLSRLRVAFPALVRLRRVDAQEPDHLCVVHCVPDEFQRGGAFLSQNHDKGGGVGPHELDLHVVLCPYVHRHPAARHTEQKFPDLEEARVLQVDDVQRLLFRRRHLIVVLHLMALLLGRPNLDGEERRRRATGKEDDQDDHHDARQRRKQVAAKCISSMYIVCILQRDKAH